MRKTTVEMNSTNTTAYYFTGWDTPARLACHLKKVRKEDLIP